MPEFYLLCHGQTLFNPEEKVQGYNDSPLTATGILQARQVSTSSFAICTLLTHLFSDLDQSRLVDHASLTIIGKKKDHYRLISYNDTSFLKEGKEKMKE